MNSDDGTVERISFCEEQETLHLAADVEPARLLMDRSADFREIGRRVAAYRQGSGLSAAEIARRLGISRSNLYRIEQGEIAKIETVFRLASLLGTSVETLLGVAVEFIPHPVVFFERVRQIDSEAAKIINFFGPISYLLTSEDYDEVLPDLLLAAQDTSVERQVALRRVDQIVATLSARKADYHRRRPDLITLVSVSEFEKFLRTGLLPHPQLSPKLHGRVRKIIFQEAERIAGIIEDLPWNVSAGIFPETLPSTPFQITRQTAGRTFLQISPFRLASEPNIRFGVAMITDAREAIRLHEGIAGELWSRALKGSEGAKQVRDLISRCTSAQ